MLATIFQLSGALILTNFFAKYESLTLMVVSQRPQNLKTFLENQVKILFACLYLFSGYYIPLLEYDFETSHMERFYVFSATTLSIITLLFITYLFVKMIGSLLYRISPVISAHNQLPEVPKYTIINILWVHFFVKKESN